jgi:hypothetical protein
MANIHRDDLSVCDDCVQMIANGDGEEALALKIAKRWPDMHLVVGDDRDEFSNRRCDGCGSNPGGSRHSVVALCEHPECAEDAPHCPDCDAPVASPGLCGTCDDDRAAAEASPYGEGYHDCPCCGETIVGREPLCASCKHAGCEATDDDPDAYEDCQIPRCPECDTEASYMNDGRWHSNCDAPCANAGKDWV